APELALRLWSRSLSLSKGPGARTSMLFLLSRQAQSQTHPTSLSSPLTSSAPEDQSARSLSPRRRPTHSQPARIPTAKTDTRMLPYPQHSMTLTARPPSLVSLYLVDMSRPV